MFSGILSWQNIYKPGSVVDNHLSRHIVAYILKRIISTCLTNSHPENQEYRSPCSRQGLPPISVAKDSCEPLPHSFHPYLEKSRRFCFCGTFPRVAPGCR